MAAIRGNTGTLSIGNTVAEVTSYTLDTSQDTAETSAMGSTSRTYVSTMQSFSGSADIILQAGTNAQHATGNAVALNFFGTGNQAAAALTLHPEGTAQDTSMTGSVIVTGYSITGSFDGVVTASVTFQGTGALTLG